MNEIIKIEARDISGVTVQTCNARDLWQFVESSRQFADWIKDRIEKYGFVEGEDFTIHKFVNGRATVTDYHLTIETAKELAMVENNDNGRQVRRYFIECERRAKIAESQVNLAASKFYALLPKTYSEALRLAADESERADQAQAKLAIAAPKAEALDRIATAEGSLCPTDAAKNLQVQPKRLFAWLQEHKWLYRRAGCPHYCGYQDKIQAGLVEQKITVVTRSDGTEKTVEQARITPKGLAKLAETHDLLAAA